MATKKAGNSSGGGLSLHGRFAPGSEVRLTKASGPEQMRPGPADEVVDTQTVDEDGSLTFAGTQPGERYFASGQIGGVPVNVRMTGRADDEEGFTSGYGGNPIERGKRGDGTWVDEPSRQELAEQAELEAIAKRSKDDD